MKHRLVTLSPYRFIERQGSARPERMQVELLYNTVQGTGTELYSTCRYCAVQ